MIRISQMKLPCGHSGKDLEGKIVKTLRLKSGQRLRYEIRRHSVDARKKPQLFDIYTVDVDLGSSLKEDRKLASAGVLPLSRTGQRTDGLTARCDRSRSGGTFLRTYAGGARVQAAPS